MATMLGNLAAVISRNLPKPSRTAAQRDQAEREAGEAEAIRIAKVWFGHIDHQLDVTDVVQLWSGELAYATSCGIEFAVSADAHRLRTVLEQIGAQFREAGYDVPPLVETYHPEKGRFQITVQRHPDSGRYAIRI